MRAGPSRTRGAICCRIQHLVTGNFPRPSPSSRRHQPSRPDCRPCVLSARRRCRRRCRCRCRSRRGCCENRSRASTREGQEPRLINGIRLIFTFWYTASILFVFTLPPACFRSSPSARSCSCTGDSPRIGLGNAPEPPKRSAVPYSRAVAEKDLCESTMQALCAVVSCTSQWRDNFTITN